MENTEGGGLCRVYECLCYSLADNNKACFAALCRSSSSSPIEFSGEAVYFNPSFCFR